MLIGAHVEPSDPLGTAVAEGADCIQMFLGDPQSWKAPPPREDADELRASPIPIYVHAPYLVNLASANNRIRIPSRKILQQSCDAAAGIGAAAVIVHGGHVSGADDEAEGFLRWRKGLERLESEVPVYLENTAGGDFAMARHFDTIARLWDHIADLGIGFCLDTCHAHAAGEELVSAVERIRGITGRIDLVHCNDSKDDARLRPGPSRASRPRSHRPRRVGRGRRRGRRTGHLRDGRGRPQGRHGLAPQPPVMR